MAIFGKKKLPDVRDDPNVLRFIDDAIRETGREPTEPLRLTYLDGLLSHIHKHTRLYLETVAGGEKDEEYMSIGLSGGGLSTPAMYKFLSPYFTDPIQWQKELVASWENEIRTQKPHIEAKSEYRHY